MNLRTKCVRVALTVVLATARLGSAGEQDTSAAALLAQRGGLAESILVAKERALGEPFDASMRASLKSRMESLSLEQLKALAEQGEAANLPLALGSVTSDLVYTPVTPCRVFDSRPSAGGPGPIAANSQWNVFVAGTVGFPAQGGAAGGCGVPVGATSAIINFVTVLPAGAGNIRAWAVADPQPPAPLAAVMNYGSVVGLPAIANGVAVPLCNPAATSCTLGDLRLQADTSATNILGDVVGYFGPAVGNYVDLATAQTVAGSKTFSSPIVGDVTGSAASVTGIVPLANGGTGSATQNFVDLTTAQTVAGDKTLTGNLNVSGTGTIGGRLGIGSPVGNPAYKLDLTNASGSFFRAFDFPAGGGTRLMADFNGGTGNGGQARFSGAGAGFIDIGQNATGDFVIETSDVPRLTVLSDGKVGIGTTTPAFPGVTVQTATDAWGLTQTDGTITVGSYVGPAPFGGWFGTTSNHPLHFFTNYSFPQVTLATSGFLGIGTDTPTDPLQVVGDVRVGTGTTGCVKDADGTVIAGTCSSDLRFKKDVTPFADILEKITQLQPVNFFWRVEEFPSEHFGVRPSFGLIAQDVEAVLPELVTADASGYRAVNYSKLPLLTIQAVKELKAENDELKARLAALEKMMRRFEEQAGGSPPEKH